MDSVDKKKTKKTLVIGWKQWVEKEQTPLLSKQKQVVMVVVEKRQQVGTHLQIGTVCSLNDDDDCICSAEVPH